MDFAEKVISIKDRDIIIPSRLKNINVETDYNAERLIFKLPMMYDDLDLTTFEIVMYIKGDGIEDIVAVRGYDIVDGFIMWTYIPSGAIVSKSGSVDIQLSAIKMNESGLSNKWQTKIAENAFYINKTMTGIIDSTVTPLPTELEQYRAEMTELLRQATEISITAVTDVVASAKPNTLEVKKSNNTSKEVVLNVVGGVTPSDLTSAISTHNAHAQAHTDIRNAITLKADKTYVDTQDNALLNQITVLSGKVNNLPDDSFNGNSSFRDYPMGRSVFLSTGAFGDSGISGNVSIEKTIWYVLLTITNLQATTKFQIITNDNIKTNWKTTATTEKTEILFTPFGNISVLENNSYQINNEIHINLYVKKTDDSVFSGAQSIGNIKAIPKTTSLSSVQYTSNSGYGGLKLTGGQSYIWTNGAIYISASGTDCKSILVSGRVVL